MKGLLGLLFLLMPAILIIGWLGLTWLLWKGGQRLLRSTFANRIVRVVLVVTIAALWFSGSFWEVAGKKMYWDTKVGALCAKDGGIKVYETVALPAEMFNRWGQINFVHHSQGLNALGPEYFVKDETQFLRPENAQPTLVRHHYQIYRRSDMKLLGERISYARRGGDLPGLWHSSSYGCPDYREKGLLDVLFINSNSEEEGNNDH